jgi:hypothetical protein
MVHSMHHLKIINGDYEKSVGWAEHCEAQQCGQMAPALVAGSVAQQQEEDNGHPLFTKTLFS